MRITGEKLNDYLSAFDDFFEEHPIEEGTAVIEVISSKEEEDFYNDMKNMFDLTIEEVSWRKKAYEKILFFGTMKKECCSTNTLSSKRVNCHPTKSAIYKKQIRTEFAYAYKNVYIGRLLSSIILLNIRKRRKQFAFIIVDKKSIFNNMITLKRKFE